MITIQDVEKLAALARLDIPADEKEGLAKDLNSILTYVGHIQDAHGKADKLGGTGETMASGAPIHNVMRDDVNPHESGIFTETLLAAVPKRDGDYVKVKKIL